MIFNFIKVGDHLMNMDLIASIDASEITQLKLTLNFLSGNTETVVGLDAIEIVMKANPSFFEGKRMNFPKRMWIIHNLIAHPLMQILALLGFKRQAMWIHDSTIPKPLGKYNNAK